MVRLFRMTVVFLSCLMACVGCSPAEREDPGCEQNSECADDQVCQSGTCVTVECKRPEDCKPNETCKDNHCQPDEACKTDDDCQEPTPLCDPSTGTCVDCLPDCAGKCCGNDGCGGTCADRCAQTGQVCNASSCECEGDCVPNCQDKQCGPDGCEDECGPGCTGDEVCNAQGRCVCVPSCQGKQCGSDGCDGECGPGCGPNETCDADGHCQPCQKDCAGRECGPDPVCGLSCGDCGPDESCNLAGQCGPWCELGEARCVNDGYGFEACGPDPSNAQRNTYGSRIPCVLGDDCSSATGRCSRHACLETETMVLLDRSSSMLAGGTWDWVTESLLAKLDLRQGRNFFGYREFPSGGGCSVGTVVGLAKNNVDAIELSMDRPEVDSATPIAAALDNFIQEYGDPNDGQAVVLITDGDETCASQAEAIEAAGRLWRAGVRVFVLAVTTVANKAFLDRVAKAGGSEHSVQVTGSTQLQAALDAVFADLNACLCAPRDAYCTGGQVFVCDAEQTGFEAAADCPLGCNAAGTDCQLCESGETRCRDDKLYACSQDRKDFVFDHDCPDGCMNDRLCEGEMALIVQGEFVRGSLPGDGQADERPQKTITLDAFTIDATEVTNAMYAACVQAGACTAPAQTSSATRSDYYGNPDYDRHPVIFVSWYHARDYCRWAGKRLPSEAEWERAARGPAPSVRIYPWGDESATCTRVNADYCQPDTQAVGSLPAGATPTGLLDMAGNVYEWVYDVYQADYYADAPSSNPLGPAFSSGMERANRGGSFRKEAFYVRAANRAGDEPHLADDQTGFRCARTPPDGDHDQDGWSPAGGDCDESEPDVHPGADEICADNIDNDCDGQTDENCA